MSINSNIDYSNADFGLPNSDSVSDVLDMNKSILMNVVGEVNFTPPTKDFVGMTEDASSEISMQLSKYCDNINNIIDKFDQTQEITSALKGQVQPAAIEFVGAIKTLYKSYITCLTQISTEMENAIVGFRTASKSISSDVEADSESIRSQARLYNLDN